MSSMPISKEKRKTQINIYGVDPAMRDRFKTHCRRLGYPMNEVLKEVIDYLLMDDNNLRRFFEGAPKRPPVVDHRG